MRGKYTVGILIAILLTAIGASFYFIMQFFEDNPNQPQQPTSFTEGIIIDMQDTSVLVISGLSVEDAKKLSVEDALEACEVQDPRLCMRVDRTQLKLHDEVRVGYTTLNESYPAKGTARTIEKLNE